MDTVDLGISNLYILSMVLLVSIGLVAFFSSAEASLISVNKLTISDHRSDAPAARVLGVISPNATITTVMTKGANQIQAPFSPTRLIATAVPREAANIMKAFSVRRMVAKNFSWRSNTRVTARADRFPCAARYRILSLLTEMRLAS